MSDVFTQEQLHRIGEVVKDAYNKGRAEAYAERDEHNQRYEYYHQRWTQLNGLAGNYADMSLKFLYTTNLAAAGGVITFIGAVAELRSFIWPYVAFFIFLSGVLLSGLLKVYLLHRVEGLRDSLRDDYGKLVENKLTWVEFLGDDETRVATRRRLPYCIGYTTLCMFIAGVVLVLCSILAGWLPQNPRAVEPLSLRIDRVVGD